MEKQTLLNDLLILFESHPDSQFYLRDLNNLFQVDVHDTLVQMERKRLVIRSTRMINDKPVTNWQCGVVDRDKERFFQKYAQPTRSNSMLSNNWRKDVPQIHVKINNINRDNMGREISFLNEARMEEGTVNYLKQASFERKMNSSNIVANRIPTPIEKYNLNPGTIAFDLSISERKEKSLSNRIFPKVPKSTLNIFSPEFVPRSQSRTTESTEKSKDSAKLDIKLVKNSSPAYVMALTKNPVSVLHEFSQQRGMECEINVVDIHGPSHKPSISTAVFLNGRKFETVVSENKKEGKRKAADAALRTLIAEGYFSENLSPTIQSDLKNPLLKEQKQSSVKEIGNSKSIYDNIASLVYKKLAELMHTLSPNDGLSLAGRKVVSAIILQDEKYDTLEVVSLATGNKCITGDKISLQGKIINDSHAEVVARRSFMFFLYKQLSHHLMRSSKSMEIFDEIENWNNFCERFFKIKDHIKFHLYISCAPCGDGALFCSKENLDKNSETQVIPSVDHKPVFESKLQGLLRTKIEGGEGTIPCPMAEDCQHIQALDGILNGERLRTMSCSDKIARWNYLGIQGCLLSLLIQPIYLHSVILGNLFSSGHLSRAICCRLEKSTISPLRSKYPVHHPNLVNIYMGELTREIDKSNELSINWCHNEAVELVDGVTGQLNKRSNSNLDFSRISKASLFYEFQSIMDKVSPTIPLTHHTYRDVKLICREFEDKKKALFLKFHCAKFGSWICKPAELSDFKCPFIT